MAERANPNHEVNLPVQETLNTDELLQQIRMVELKDGEDGCIQRLYQLCMQVVTQHPEWESVVIELFINKLPERIRKCIGSRSLTSLFDSFQLLQKQFDVPTDISPGEAAESQQQQESSPIQETAEETGSRLIAETNKKATTHEPCLLVVTTKSETTSPEITLDDQRLKEQITNPPENRKIQNPKHDVILKILTPLKLLHSVSFTTEGGTWNLQLTNLNLDESMMSNDGDSTEEAKIFLRFILFGGKLADVWVFDRLEKDLLETLDGITQFERLQKALEHPIFYSENKKLELIRVIANKERKKKKEPMNDQKEKGKKDLLINNQTEKTNGFILRTYKEWKTSINKIEPELINEMEEEGSKQNNKINRYSNTLYGLLRFIRNCMVYRCDEAVKMNFTSIFPYLFEDVYMLTKQDWSSSSIQAIIHI